MRLKTILWAAALAALASSCSTPKIAYFQDMKAGQSVEVAHDLNVRVRPDDKISIIVNSKDPQLTNLFNLPYVSRQLGSVSSSSSTSSGTGSNQGISGYTVDEAGDITFPVLGQVRVAGMTRSEIATHIAAELKSRNLVNDPTVTVEFMNLTVSVLGEVASPGRYSIDKDRMTLLEALSLAGDLTVNGKRENVTVQREEGGRRVTYRVNLKKGAELYASPVYYLQQNDVVYVEPNSKKAREATVNGNAVRQATFWMSLASLLMSAAVLIWK